MDWRNDNTVKLARLRSTDSLGDRLEMGPLGMVRTERKIDGHRVTLQFGGGFAALLVSRGTSRAKGEYIVLDTVPSWVRELDGLPCNLTVLDGELAGPPGMTASEGMRHEHVESWTMSVFDCLVYDGEDVRSRSLRHRLLCAAYAVTEASIAQVVLTPGMWVETFDRDDMEALQQRARDEGVEGFVVKDAESIYGAYFGWKIKPNDPEDAVVMGWTRGKGRNRARVGSFMVGQYADGKLEAVTYVGVSRLEIALDDAGDYVGRVVEFRHRGLDEAGMCRSPTFVDWRQDKPAEECVRR